MSAHTVEMRDGSPVSARQLVARAAAASARARRRTAAEVRDLLSDGDARLDDRTRTAAAACIDALVTALDRRIRARAIAHLKDHDATAIAERLDALTLDMTATLADAAILSENALIEEVLGRVGEAMLAERMPVDLPADPDQPGLVMRLTQARDAKVADAARALIGADAARRAELEGRPSAGDLPSSLRAHLAWPIVAVLRNRMGGDAVLDSALSYAATQVIGSIGDVHPLEAMSMRLAKTLHPDEAELTLLIDDALDDRRLSLVIALIARALGTDYSAIRAIVLDPDGERLWLALRALGFDRRTIARIGYMLSEADPRRSSEAFADQIDLVMAVPMDDAREVTAELCLPLHFRESLYLLDRRGIG